MDKKKILLIVSIVLIIASIVVSVILLVNKPEEEEFKIEGIDLPKNQEILKDVSLDGIEITNVSLLTREGMSTYKALLTNETENDISAKILNITFYEDEEERTVTKNITLTAGSSMYINIESEIDLSKTTKIEYILE